RRRFVLLAGKGFEIQIPKATHSNKREKGLQKWVPLKEALRGLGRSVSLSKATKRGGPQRLNWHVTRNISEENVERLKYLRPGGQRFDIPDHLRPKCHKGKNKGFSNVYSRMAWSDVAPTITGGCTVLSKGRFGHPSALRTISVREAARIQTFPDSYRFATDSIDQVCKIIGNALPCKFAKAMSKACFKSIKKNESKIH
ncbi:MAG: DNA cytosine methyltransferase, partial [Kangiellaceae bacterium]|nr:DNA cytosine methyltransferase [Kangiellaceae bacterium]